MFLLKRESEYDEAVELFTFTFHNVSIKTDFTKRKIAQDTTLHSTMFLLKRIVHREEHQPYPLYIPQCFY